MTAARPSRTHEVRKLSYSSKPWRIVEVATGREVWIQEVFDHPMLGQTVIPAPLCFERKRDAVAALRDADARAAGDGAA